MVDQRPDRDTYFLRMARLVATRSTCQRRAVGCVLVNDHGHVMATGYNGVPAGWPHCRGGQSCAGAGAASGTALEACEAIHAEQNAVLQCDDALAIAACYVTCEPCVTCAKLLLNTSCQRIIAAEAYAGGGRELWRRGGRSFMVLK